MLRKTTIAFLVLTVFSCVSLVAKAQSDGKIQFNVLMPNDVLNPNVTLLVEGENYRKELELNAEAIDAKQNLLTLPSGVYRLSSRKGNFHEFRRAPFRVTAGQVTKINVFPLIRMRSQTLMADGADRYDFAAEPKYDSFPVPGASDSALVLMIRYDEKSQIKGMTRYSSSVRESRGDLKMVARGVMISYDNLSIYADRVDFDPSHLVINATGNVVLEDGQQRKHLHSVVVALQNGAAEVVRSQ